MGWSSSLPEEWRGRRNAALRADGLAWPARIGRVVARQDPALAGEPRVIKLLPSAQQRMLVSREEEIRRQVTCRPSAGGPAGSNRAAS
jgi:hypothetical protein